MIRRRRSPARLLARALGAAAIAAVVTANAGAAPSAVQRGEYLLHAAGCIGCHTDVEGKGPYLAGGRALATPFGTFYPPNITPDPDHGLGRWTEREFAAALGQGTGRGGVHLYPVFPFPSYTLMRPGDVADLWAYLRTVPLVARANRSHRLVWFVRWRFANVVWKWLFFEPGPYRDDANRSATWNRGAYIVRALAHCGECHTPRDRLGAVDRSRALAGNPHGPDDSPVPNITPDPETGIGRWSKGDLMDYFTLGLKPDGDVVGGAMAEVIDEELSHLTKPDLEAIIEYLRTVPAVHSPRVAKKKR